MRRNNKKESQARLLNIMEYFGSCNKIVTGTMLVCFQLTQWFYTLTPLQMHVYIVFENLDVTFRLSFEHR